MAKVSTAKAKAVPTVVMGTLPDDPEITPQLFRVNSDTTQVEIVRMDGMIGTRLEFDYVHFQKMSDEFVARLRPDNQKAYWLAFAEFDSRNRQANIAMHSIGVDPLTKILDRPHGTNNPVVRDGNKVQKILGKDWYVTWRVQGGEGDLEGAREVGFKIIRKPATPEEEKTKTPFEWSGEVWKIKDGTSDPASGDEIYNVMVVIRRRVWDDNLKAMSMASHNAYSQNKKQFFDGAENISRDMLGGREKVILSDLDETHVEEHYDHREGKRVRVDS
jgi:hypothetical protein